MQKNFSEQIGTWCRAHGVQYIGHLIEDNNQHTRTGSSLGYYFRGLSGQDMAGIDDIGGQVLPGGEHNGLCGLMGDSRNGRFYHYVLGRLGASLASIDPTKHGDCLCEIFGNYGWEEGVRLEKYLADHFLVRGVNHFVPHAFSMKEYPDPAVQLRMSLRRSQIDHNLRFAAVQQFIGHADLRDTEQCGKPLFFPFVSLSGRSVCQPDYIP